MQLEQLNEQLDQAKRAKGSLEKIKSSMESENHEMANEIKQLSAGKQVRAPALIADRRYSLCFVKNNLSFTEHHC